MKTFRNKEEQRRKLLIGPPVADAKSALDEHPFDADLWYAYGMSLFRSARYEDADNAFSQGLVYDPFHAYLYFGRGRAKTKANRFWPGVADFEMALRLDAQNWNFWYYLATAYNIEGYYQESIDAFTTAIKFAYPDECYPMVNWIYQTYLLELHSKENAQKTLSLIGDDVVPPPNDYGYCRNIALYKGLVTPDNFVDLKDMEEKCVKKPGRIELELNGMYYALYAYSVMIDDEALGRKAISELLKVGNPTSFGYIKGKEVAKCMGLLKENQ